MVWVDIGIIFIVALSAFISLLRGFVREALSLAGWIAAFWVAFTFSDNLARPLSRFIDNTTLALVSAFAILLVVTLIITALVNYLAGQLVRKTGISGTDRVLGVVFGVLRGGVIIAILVLLAGATQLPQDPWWRESLLIEHFQEVAIWLRGKLPPEYADKFVYE